ncbi:MAG TPA: DUF892 family protein [Steroidobacteraceae bacterium]|jgi:ferritin-like metal-binding protein YciE|nr:DUF892 family protein [Steroidobacteraceae bacterium]
MTTRGVSTTQSVQQPLGCEDLLFIELQAIYDAESELSATLPELSKVVELQALRKLMEERGSQAQQIIQEIQEVFEEMDQRPRRKRNPAAEGLVWAAREHIREIAPGPALDVALIASIQKTEYYCTAARATAEALSEAAFHEYALGAMGRAIEEGVKFADRLNQLARTEVIPALLALEAEGQLETEGQGLSGG